MEARPDSVTENKTVEHMERIFQTAKQTGFEVFISPHYYFPTDDRWQFRDPLGSVMHENHLFARTGALTLEEFSGSGADWLTRFKPYIEDGKTIVVSPDKAARLLAESFGFSRSEIERFLTELEKP